MNAAAFVYNKLGLRRDTTIGKHRLPSYRVDAALTNLIFYGFILFVGLYILCMTESQPFSNLLFEATSALGTVGLSMDTTSELTTVGKIVIIFLMYAGRIGVLTLGTSMLIRMKKMPKKKKNSDLAI